MGEIMKKKKNDNIIEKLISGKTKGEEREELIHSLIKQKSKKPNNTKESLTFGQRVADKMAAVAGSWPFIIVFCIILIIWILLNIYMAIRAFDPYPFILLNLALSCLAAIQAPIIMMSQNRQNDKDRIKSESDYQVNVKSEIILEDLHNKIDELIANQEKLLKRNGRSKTNK